MTELKRIIKRDGTETAFDEQKIQRAILKALAEVEPELGERKLTIEAERLTKVVINILLKAVNGDLPTVEQVQDIVEPVLMAAGHYEAAKAYILYRDKRRTAREARAVIGVKDDLNLSLNQLKVLENRYLRHDASGRATETPRQLFDRVAGFVAENEPRAKRAKWRQAFFEVMTKMEFVPAGCYLRSAGTKKPSLANCFVLPVEDDMAKIFDAVKWLALVQQRGGGTGFNFSKLRPKGDYVMKSGGFATGPVSFMKVFDAATGQVMQGGYRMGANMGILNVDHPDILEFITCKTNQGEITNFNISVGATDEFMRAVKHNRRFELKNPRSGEVVQSLPAKQLFDQIVGLAWRTGDPGMIFLDKINKSNPVLATLGPLMATNPCGEQPLHPFDVCNLGSLNLAKFVKVKRIDWDRLKRVTQTAVRFLDNGIDVSGYPIPQVAKMAKANRRIGLGVMGWADMLYQLGIAYNSHEGVKLAQKVMKAVNDAAVGESVKLAREKGIFKNWKGSAYEKKGIKRRNLAVTTIAPTGTIAMVAGCSSGIEPEFALSFVKNVVDEAGLTYVNQHFRQAVEASKLSEYQKKQILEEVAKSGSCQDIEYLSSAIRKTFVSAFDITPEWHIKMQAAFQNHTENAVSKTINFPQTATIEDVTKAYLLAWELGCKGITIYRSGSKDAQILSSPASAKASAGKQTIQSKVRITPLKNKNDKLCPECGNEMEVIEGCSTCKHCGFSKCSL
ncbi:MAG: adenosylcobalamin-dependent ribonucleoside-diphosphate reductase [Candidatus Beckwithbacteria bacterium]|nr:adenosylcobalamin-dependent ribonucleoside-diphosphate reductase [Candidatus Beckwithbacteria bacterium]